MFRSVYFLYVDHDSMYKSDEMGKQLRGWILFIGVYDYQKGAVLEGKMIPRKELEAWSVLFFYFFFIWLLMK